MTYARNKTSLLRGALLPMILGGLLGACGDDDETAPGRSGANPDASVATNLDAISSGGGTDGATATCPTQTAVESDVTASTTWSCPVYVLKRKIYVASGATLTIPAGTQVLGDPAATDKAALIVTRGAQLVVQGTKEKPVIFSSAATPGSRKGGDWAGVALLGSARINSGAPCAAGGAGCYEAGIEGIAASETRAKYGGLDDASSCGSIEYARIEFAGAELEPMRELNGLTLGGCGSGTKLSYIQVHRGTDDGIEFFGGTASMDHVVLTGNEDDSLDWDFGWSGKVQFLVVQQRAGIGDNGIEAAGSPTSETATPRAEPVLSNVTMVGRPEGGRAITFKEGTRGKLYNFIIQGWKGDVVDFQVKAGDLTTEWPGFLTLENSLFFSNGAYATEAAGMPSDDDKGFADQAAIEAAERKNRLDVDPMLTSVVDTAPNWIPTNAAVGGQATPSFGDVTATYAGAFAPNATAAWTDGWTAFPTN